MQFANDQSIANPSFECPLNVNTGSTDLALNEFISLSLLIALIALESSQTYTLPFSDQVEQKVLSSRGRSNES